MNGIGIGKALVHQLDALGHIETGVEGEMLLLGDTIHVDFNPREIGGPWRARSQRYVKARAGEDNESSSISQFTLICIKFNAGGCTECMSVDL